MIISERESDYISKIIDPRDCRRDPRVGIFCSAMCHDDLTRGGAEVSAEWKDGRVVSCKVSADRKFAGKITANGKEYEIKLSSGETAEII